MLFVEERGSGVPVVVLHGSPTTIAHVRPLAERLAVRRRSLVVHLPGYGESARLDPYDLDRSHALVEEVLVSLGVSAAHFVGHSGGGYRSFALACRREIRAISVTGIGALADVPPDEADGLREYVRLIHAGVDPIPILDQIMLSPDARKDAEIVAGVHAWASACPLDHLASELGAFACAPDLRPALASRDFPILLRVGALDMASPPARSERIAAMVKRATLQIVEGKGHTILAEDLEASLAAMESHFDAAER